jgi:hypothetical protein
MPRSVLAIWRPISTCVFVLIVLCPRPNPLSPLDSQPGPASSLHATKNGDCLEYDLKVFVYQIDQPAPRYKRRDSDVSRSLDNLIRGVQLNQEYNNASIKSPCKRATRDFSETFPKSPEKKSRTVEHYSGKLEKKVRFQERVEQWL